MKAIQYFPGAFVLILFYAAYIQFYHHTCWTLIFPVAVTFIIGINQYKYMIYKKKCVAECFLRPGTTPYNIMRSRKFSILISLVISFVYAVSLMSFFALKSWPALWFVFINIFLIAVFYFVCNSVIQKYVSPAISDIINRKMVAWISFIFIFPIYLWIAFNTPVPEYVDPGSLERTIAAATSDVATLCPVTNYVFKTVHELDAAFYYFSVYSSLKLKNQWIKFAIWMLFFLKSSLVFLAMSKFNVEIISMISGYFSGYKEDRDKGEPATEA